MSPCYPKLLSFPSNTAAQTSPSMGLQLTCFLQWPFLSL